MQADQERTVTVFAPHLHRNWKNIISMDFLKIFLIVYSGATGLYLILAACVPFDFVTTFGVTSYIQIKPLDTLKARASTFFSGVLYIVASIFFVLLFYGAQLRMFTNK
jgi:hypothetical protein